MPNKHFNESERVLYTVMELSAKKAYALDQLRYAHDSQFYITQICQLGRQCDSRFCMVIEMENIPKIHSWPTSRFVNLNHGPSIFAFFDCLQIVYLESSI